jgi:AcrR family transcriptional regulator
MKSRETYHHGDLRQTLIDTAIELVAEQGMTQWSLREVARRIGVSHTAPYRHFSDRDSLLAAVAERGFQEMSQHLQQTLNKIATDPQKRLQAIGVAYVQYAIAHPCEYQVMFRTSLENEHKDSDLAKAATKAFSLLVDIIAEGQKAGVFRQDNSKELAQVAWSLVHGLSMLLIDGQLKVPDHSSVEILANYTTQMLLEGIKIGSKV